MARTKVIATIGPACRSVEMLEKLILAGMDVARINCSHADHESIASITVDIREISQRLDRSVGILLDLSGPKIRTGRLLSPPVTLVKGEHFTLTNRKVDGDETIVTTTMRCCRKTSTSATPFFLMMDCSSSKF